MIAAEELGVPLDQVFVTAADTDVTTDTGGSTGSRQTMTGGTGIRLAAADAKRAVCKTARADVIQAEASIRLARVQHGRTVLVAPFDGTVAKISMAMAGLVRSGIRQRAHEPMPARMAIRKL